MNLPRSISGFTVIPLSYSSSSTHYIYARPHSYSRRGSTYVLPEGRTLFLVNIPPDVTERELILFFKPYGTVERVLFDLGSTQPNNDVSDSEEDEVSLEVNEGEPVEQPSKRRKTTKEKEPKIAPLPSHSLRTLRKTGGSAHVVFLDSSSLGRALVSSTKNRSWPPSTGDPSGLAHYTAQYGSLRPPLDAVKEYADTSIDAYEYQLVKTKQRSKYRKGEAIVDEDGFTLVTRGGAYGKTLGGGVGVASKKFQAGHRKRNKTKEGKNKESFYAFQKAEKQRNELLELKKKWEADKEKIEKLKASRRFKPY